jgi:biotin carboxyl carrier protein
MHGARTIATRLGLVGLLISAAGTAAHAQAQLPPSLELRVPKAPTVATSLGGAFLAYELHVTNFGAQPVTLRAMEVVDTTPSRRVLFTLADSALLQSIGRPGLTAPAAERARIAGNGRAVVFVWMPVDTSAAPMSFRNRARVEIGTGDSVRVQELEGPVVAVTRTGPVIGPPLRGGPWLAGNGPNARSGHRRALIATGGAPSIAQRFAIDWVKLNDSSTTFHDDKLRNENYYAEGNDALAVANGIVVAVKDSIPENVPGVSSRAVPITLETVGGNHVIIDIGGGYYAFYAHLRPGSLRVKVGDRVKRGQVVGLVGNSGNSTEPHLHFHVSDANSPLGSEGIPYRLDSFELVGSCTSFGAGCNRNGSGTRHHEIPLANAIVRFP